MAGIRTTTKLVNTTGEVLHFFVESSGDNYSFKKTLQPGQETTEEFDPNSTFTKLRMFDSKKAPTDISITTDDMIDNRVITITEVIVIEVKAGTEEKVKKFVLGFTNAESGETKTMDASRGSSWSIFGFKLGGS